MSSFAKTVARSGRRHSVVRTQLRRKIAVRKGKLPVQRFVDRRGRGYLQLPNGSLHRAVSDREDRKLLGLSPRQYRRAKHASRQEAKL